MTKKVWVTVVAVVVLIGAAYHGFPFWAARQFRDAAISADVDELDAAVDFPAVRESMKSQLTVAMTAKMQKDLEMKDNPFAGLGLAIMPASKRHIRLLLAALVNPSLQMPFRPRA